MKRKRRLGFYPTQSLQYLIVTIVIVYAMIHCNVAWSDAPPDLMVGAKINFSTTTPYAFVYSQANVVVDTNTSLGFAVLPGEGYQYQEWAYDTRLTDAPLPNRKEALKIRVSQKVTEGYFVIDGMTVREKFQTGAVDLSQSSAINILRSLGEVPFCSDIFTIHIQSKCPKDPVSGKLMWWGTGSGRCALDPMASTTSIICPLLDWSLIKSIRPYDGPFNNKNYYANGGPVSLDYFPPEEAKLLMEKPPHYVCTGTYTFGMSDITDTYISYNDDIGRDALKSLCIYTVVNGYPCRYPSCRKSSRITPTDFQQLQLLKKSILNHKNVFLLHEESDD